MGKVAQQIEEDMRTHNGFLMAEDLALIPWPIERKTIRRRYRGFSVYTLPPPAAGQTLLLTLLILNNLLSRFLHKETPEKYNFMSEAFRKSFLQHRQRPYDPNTYPQLPEKK